MDRSKQAARVSSSMSSLVCLAALSLACISMFNLNVPHVEAGGKGKVPIYMPIPVPIPMPMPAQPNSGHKHQQHSNDGGGGQDGEVKKIYILQPMPRGPQQQQHQQQYHHYGEGFPPHQPAPAPQQAYQFGSNKGSKQAHQQQDNNDKHGLKILPIVVIPPIAPMLPIQLGQSASAGERNHKKLMNLLYDHKTFSDYGSSGSGPSAMSFLNTDGDSPSSSRRVRMLHRSFGGPTSGRNPFGSSKSSIEDFLDYSGDNSRRTARAANARMANQARRRNSGQVTSIRDIVERGMLDDVEPSNLMLDMDRRRSGSAIQGCCSERDDAELSMDGTSLVDQHNLAQQVDRNSDQFAAGRRFQQQQQEQQQLAGDILDEDYQGNLKGSLRHQKQHRFNTDFMPSSSQGRVASVGGGGGSTRFRNIIDYDTTVGDSRAFRAKSPYWGQSDLTDSMLNSSGADDDEWRFDSVKSLAYSNPPPVPYNSTTSSGDILKNSQESIRSKLGATTVPVKS